MAGGGCTCHIARGVYSMSLNCPSQPHRRAVYRVWNLLELLCHPHPWHECRSSSRGQGSRLSPQTGLVWISSFYCCSRSSFVFSSKKVPLWVHPLGVNSGSQSWVSTSGKVTTLSLRSSGALPSDSADHYHPSPFPPGFYLNGYRSIHTDGGSIVEWSTSR